MAIDNLKILHVAIRDGLLPESKIMEYNGLIYDPLKLFSKENNTYSVFGYREFSDFFSAEKTYKISPLTTRMNPSSLGEAFYDEFGSFKNPIVGESDVVLFQIQPKKVDKLLWELTNLSLKYLTIDNVKPKTV